MAQGSGDGYTTLSIPNELRERVTMILEQGKSGYVSFSEFAKDAIRRRLEQLERKTIASEV